MLSSRLVWLTPYSFCSHLSKLTQNWNLGQLLNTLCFLSWHNYGNKGLWLKTRLQCHCIHSWLLYHLTGGDFMSIFSFARLQSDNSCMVSVKMHFCWKPNRLQWFLIENNSYSDLKMALSHRTNVREPDKQYPKMIQRIHCHFLLSSMGKSMMSVNS